MSATDVEILVVDDDPVACAFLKATLRRLGYRVCLVESGEAALALLEADPKRFHTVLLDRCMGGIDGIEVLRRIKKDPRLAALPVILQTALDRSEDILEGMQAGAFYYLPKPMSPELTCSITKTAVDDHFRYREVQESLRVYTKSLSLLEYGTFKLQTLEEANGLSHLLAHACPEPDTAVLCLSELLINAIEHGNLAIDYHLKGALLAEGRLHEEIRHRLTDPRWKDKWVNVEVKRSADDLRITIQDEGPGFDWKKYKKLDDLNAERLLDTHGRGIFLASSMGFDSMEYLGAGNVVSLCTKLPQMDRSV